MFGINQLLSTSAEPWSVQRGSWLSRSGAKSYLAIALAAINASASLAEGKNSCATDTRVVEPCFTVRGRLAAYNGAPNIRIWVVGTHRVLGISQGRYAPSGYDMLPSGMPQAIEPEAFYFGNFTVCPFTKEEPGLMRMVCVAAVDKLRMAPQVPATSNTSLERARDR